VRAVAKEHGKEEDDPGLEARNADGGDRAGATGQRCHIETVAQGIGAYQGVTRTQPVNREKDRQSMKKSEIVHLHQLLAQCKLFFEAQGCGDFSKYNELGISPYQLRHTKEEHKRAIFLLVTALAAIAAEDLRNE
jgi:hypothetical protein